MLSLSRMEGFVLSPTRTDGIVEKKTLGMVLPLGDSDGLRLPISVPVGGMLLDRNVVGRLLIEGFKLEKSKGAVLGIKLGSLP
mmetsp:Transcript_7295/g.11077  ORF Transcript_7295/g.11077 Transcript_7295/m.11077 type:complete len:83 (-) Transcript_7295:65-313(-)